MYSCASCGGDLKYDIASGQLACVYCDTKYDPYEISKESDGEQDSYDVTVFKCPQCGGEIYSTDNTAAGFCSFCGASTILSSRLKRERRVDYVIPFRKTKEDCKQAYQKLMRHAIFAPKELKDPKNIDGFRGIYMPYWVYYVKQQGHTHLHGTMSHRSGDYIITEHYGLSMDVDAQYKGLSYDASSSFADNISEKLAPYDIKNMRPFTPSLLSGFYADVSDVESEVYAQDAVNFACEETAYYIKRNPAVRQYSLDDSEKLKRCFPTELAQTDSAMFPVWFLSYRNKDRVAYATVNGQTGKVVADLPVDILKYLIGSLILAIPIILGCNAFLTLQPTVLLPMVAVIAAFVIGMHAMEMKQIFRQEGYEDDKGAQIGIENKRKKEREAARRSMEEMGGSLDPYADEPYVIDEYQLNKSLKKEKKIKTKNKTGCFVLALFFVTLFYQVLGTVALVVAELFGVTTNAFISVISLIVAIIFAMNSIKTSKKIAAKKSNIGATPALIAVILATVIMLWNPVSDTYYYIGVVLALIAIFFTLLDLIQSYNILATRRLPQFDYKGGDDLA